ncbi:MAG: hypothetical protein ACR2OC_10910 [Solirubrobacterales bacterium]
MAVRASNLALGDLGFEALEPHPGPSHGRDTTTLLTHVIEVENDEVSQTAIDAAACQQGILHMQKIP